MLVYPFKYMDSEIMAVWIGECESILFVDLDCLQQLGTDWLPDMDLFQQAGYKGLRAINNSTDGLINWTTLPQLV